LKGLSTGYIFPCNWPEFEDTEKSGPYRDRMNYCTITAEAGESAKY